MHRFKRTLQALGTGEGFRHEVLSDGTSLLHCHCGYPQAKLIPVPKGIQVELAPQSNPTIISTELELTGENLQFLGNFAAKLIHLRPAAKQVYARKGYSLLGQKLPALRKTK